MKIKTSLLQGEALDYASAVALKLFDPNGDGSYSAWKKFSKWDPSHNGDVTNMVIATEGIGLSFNGRDWEASSTIDGRRLIATANTHTVAILRCNAIIKLGDEIEIPPQVASSFSSPLNSAATDDSMPRARGSISSRIRSRLPAEEVEPPNLIKYETPHFFININPATKRGKFTSKNLGSERSGDLIFEERDGKLLLHDYDGVFMLPPQVEECLAKNGVDVSYASEQSNTNR